MDIPRLLLALGALLTGAGAAAQGSYPDKPVQVVLPLQAGSASDVAIRVVAERLAESLKQSVTVENVTGAAGLIGTDRLLKSRPDGYTLAALNNSILTILPNIQKDKVRFDPFSDFVPIGGIASIPTLLGVHRDLPVKNVQELVALAKAQPGRLNYSSGGAGSPQHLATEMFMAMAGVRLTHVPYKGAQQAATDLAAGQVQVMFIAHSLALPHLPSGRVRPIAFAGGTRSPAFPELPTVAEAGVPGYDYASWIALFAPKGTPEDIVARLRAELQRVMTRPEVLQKLAGGGLESWAVPHDRLSAAIREDFARWQQVVRTANISAN
ncbi:MAG: tripartite tricarboxylate transporter substrate binding protein [Burkholderiales bacterium]|nr:tripartite tricarboxylate transporter substrate binding protein [Burkholderiales bacterium]